jgi:rubredoxin
LDASWDKINTYEIDDKRAERLMIQMVVLTLKRFQCNICGYIYDPQKGDSDSKIAPGTPFSDLPEGWLCPQCGASKADFKELD